MQKENNMAVTSSMTFKIGLIWHHMKTLYSTRVLVPALHKIRSDIASILKMGYGFIVESSNKLVKHKQQ